MQPAVFFYSPLGCTLSTATVHRIVRSLGYFSIVAFKNTSLRGVLLILVYSVNVRANDANDALIERQNGLTGLITLDHADVHTCGPCFDVFL